MARELPDAMRLIAPEAIRTDLRRARACQVLRRRWVGAAGRKELRRGR